MSDTIKVPDPNEPRKVVNPPTSWVEPRKEPLPPEHTVVAPSSIDEFPAEVRPFALDPNRQVNQYILVKVLGKGGMGEVWKAWDRKLTRWAAIKFLLGESQEGVARFKREAKMAARLSHPNIAPVHEVGEAPSRQPGQPSAHYLAMEYIDGTTLGSAKLSLRDRVDVFVKVAQGIEAAHKGGVVHRDIKPANIMLTKENWPYVMDFGLAKSLDGDNNLSATGAVMGTPAFMPPEQVEGRLDEIGPWSDVYSLGASMYAVFCGVHPFTAQTTLQLLQKVVNEPPPSPRQKNPEIPAELDAIILKSMAKKKEDRYASSGAVAEALRKVLVRMDAAAESPAAPAPPPPPPKSSVLPAVAAILLLVGAAGAAAWWYLRRPPPPVVVAPPEPKAEPVPLAKVELPPLVVPSALPGPTPETKPEPKPESKPEPKPEPKPAVAGDPVQRAYDWLARQSGLDPWSAYALVLAPNAVPREKVLEFLRQPARGTTATAARVLAMAASRVPELQELTAEGAQFLIEVQGPNGLWADDVEAEVRLDDAKPAEGSAFILSGDPARRRFELSRKGTATKVLDGNVATTHLALLALAAAEGCGHRVPAETWTRALQAVDAAWVPEADPATNAACIVSSIVCRRALGQPITRALEAVAALGTAPWPLLERVGSLLGTATFGNLDWHAAGSKAIAASQQPDGSWSGAGATGQALVFLLRGTAASLGKKGGTGRLEMKSLGGCANVFFVLDGSGYMRQELDGRERFDVAKESIQKVVEKLPDGAIVGLRVFGNRKAGNEPGCETDSTLVAPPVPVNRRQLATHLGALQVKGWSPLTFSLIQAVKDLSRIPPEVEIGVVLFVDGLDTDRKSDPVPAAGDLSASRPGMKVHVVGFNTDDDDIQERLQKMADSGGGRYIKARSAKELPAQVLAATIGIQDYEVLNARGESVAKGRLGDSRELPEGRYTVVVGKQQEKVWINPAQTTRVIVNQEKLVR